MSDGLGAGFAALSLFAVLAGLAGLLVVVGAVAVAARARWDRVPRAVRYLAVALLVAVVAVAGFAVLALFDEAPVFVPLFVGLVGIPLVVVAARGRRAGAAWLDVGTTAALAWAVPFLLAAGLTLLLAAQQVAAPAVASLVAGVVATGGTLLAGEAVRPVVAADDPAVSTNN